MTTFHTYSKIGLYREQMSSSSSSSDQSDNSSSDEDEPSISLNDRLKAHNEIPIKVQSELPPVPLQAPDEAATTTKTTTPEIAEIAPASAPASAARVRGGRRKRKDETTRQALNPQYNHLSSFSRVKGGGFGKGYSATVKRKTVREIRLERATLRKNSSDYLNLQSHKGFGQSAAIEFAPVPKDYTEIVEVLNERYRRPGPGHYHDGLSDMFKFGSTKNITMRKITGPRYELEISAKIKRSTKYEDPNWKLQHLLPGSLHRFREREASRTTLLKTARVGVDEEGGEEKTKRTRPSTAGSARGRAAKNASGRQNQLKQNIERSSSYKKFQNKRLPMQFGPGFGRPMHTPIRRWKKKVLTKNMKEELLGSLGRLTKMINGKKKFIDPAMIPKISRGSCIAPITSLSNKHLKLLERAQRRAAGLEKRENIGPRGIGAPEKKKIDGSAVKSGVKGVVEGGIETAGKSGEKGTTKNSKSGKDEVDKKEQEGEAAEEEDEDREEEEEEEEEED